VRVRERANWAVATPKLALGRHGEDVGTKRVGAGVSSTLAGYRGEKEVDSKDAQY